MAKANVKLPDGTTVEVSGSPEEIARVLSLYGGSGTQSSSAAGSKKKTSRKKTKKKAASKGKSTAKSTHQVDWTEIVNLVKTCDEAEAIEEKILDQTSQVNRTLLPLYIVHEHLDNGVGLTSGDVNKVTTDLGIPIATANASRTLSGTASRYVIADRVRKKGAPVRYKLSRRGVQYLKGVISGDG